MANNSDLILFHPQWQGCGHDDAVRHGAAAIRKRLEATLNMQFHDIDVDSESNIDLSPAMTASIQNLLSLISNHNRVLHAVSTHQPTRIFTLGGDCGVSLHPVTYLNEKLDDFAVLWIDAHADLNNPSTSPSGNFHGMVLRSILEGVNVQQEKVSSKPLRPEQVFLVGTRDLDTAEAEFIAEKGISIVSCDELAACGAASILTLLKERGLKRVYLHVDVDVMDPEEFPYSFYNVPGGIKIEILRGLVDELRECEGVEVVGGSLKEVVPGIEGDERVLGAVCEIFGGICGVR